MRLLLIRHGQTSSNVNALLDTAPPGPGLTEVGSEQAAALPGALNQERIDAIYASTLIRTQLTAAPLAHALGLSVRVRAGLREVGAGELEMRGDAAAKHEFLSTVFGWAAGELDVPMPGGADGRQTLADFDAVIAEIVASGYGSVAVFSHGAVIRLWVAARVANVQLPWVRSHPLANAGVVRLDGQPAGGWYMQSWSGTESSAADGPAGQADWSGG